MNNEGRSGLVINFHPDGNDPRFVSAAKEYEGIWREDGDRIVSAIESVSGLSFRERSVDALVYDGISWSDPLKFRFSYTREIKKGAIVHELVHRILIANPTKHELGPDDYNFEVHRLANLVLYDAWVDLYGEEFARENIEFEKELMMENGVSPYKRAWDWALSMTREQRAEELRKYF